MNEKKFDQIVPGSPTGVNVIDGEITIAVRDFKRNVKESEKLKQLYIKRYYVKPSDKKRKILDNAKFLQKRISDKNKDNLNVKY